MEGTANGCLRHRHCVVAVALAAGKDVNVDYAVVEAKAQHICPGCLAVKGMGTVDLDISG
jgi:hypothetical protein